MANTSSELVQPIFHTINAVQQLTSVLQFWMANLVGEIGIVLLPAISGTLRDTTNSWSSAVFMDAAIILALFVLVLGKKGLLRWVKVSIKPIEKKVSISNGNDHHLRAFTGQQLTAYASA